MFAIATALLLQLPLPPSGGVAVTREAARDSVVVYKTAEEILLTLRKAEPRPKIDGRLDDEAWNHAPVFNRFVQYEPVDNVFPPQPSEGRVTYDAGFIYVGFRAFEPERSNIRATIHPRERGGELDDKIAVSIDTYNDNRRTYVFRVSPVGLQFDGVKTEGQRTDDTPDLVWFAAAQIDSLGWTAEFAIPFASLRLPPGSEHEFGMDMVRYHGKAGVRSSWAPRRRGSPCDICQQGTVRGLTGVSTGRTFDLLPYVSGNESGTRAFLTDSTLIGGTYHSANSPQEFGLARPTGSVGADLRATITPSTVLNATVNPDFSQVESDDEQVRVNQRFALFFQERRPFFLESKDVFEVSRQGEAGGGAGELVYTRAIVDPSVGGRITGKSGATSYGFLYARDDNPAFFYYDGYEGSGVESTIGSPADVVVSRVRRDVLKDSWLGASFLGRRGGSSESAIGEADIALRRGRLTFAAEGGYSQERAPNQLSLSERFDGQTREGRYYSSRIAQAGRSFNWSMSASALSPGFRNQLGRYSRIGIESYGARAQLDQYPNNRILQKVTQSLSVGRTNVYGGGFLDYTITPRVELTFRQRAALNASWMIERQTILGRELAQQGVFADFRVESSRWVQFGGFLYGGDRELFDPDSPRVTKGIFGNLRVTIRPTPQASLEIRGQRSNHFDGWGGNKVDDANIVRLRGTYQFSRRLGARLIGEYSNQFNTLVSNPLSERVIRYTSSILVTYELAPSSFLFVGYNELQQDYDTPVVPRPQVMRTGNQIFMKVSYLFRR